MVMFIVLLKLSLPLVEPPSSNPPGSPGHQSSSFMSSNCTSIVTLSEPNQIAKFCLSTSFNSSKVNYYSNSNKITITFMNNVEVVYRFLPNVISSKGVLLQGTICSILYENCSRSSSGTGKGGQLKPLNINTSNYIVSDKSVSATGYET